jgi:hypothetical protein
MILGHQLPKARSFGEQWREKWWYLQRFVGFTGAQNRNFCHNITGPQDQEWRILRQQTLRFHPKNMVCFHKQEQGV